MQPYQQRVIDEKRELDEKAAKLAAFLKRAEGLRPSEINAHDLALLRIQHAIMDAYSAVLAERIGNFDSKVA